MKKAVRYFGSAEFGAVTLIGNDSPHHVETSGLVVASPATRMLGRFSKLKALDHPNLCKYVELVRSTAIENGVFLISEHYSWSAADELKQCRQFKAARIISLLEPILSAFAYLHSHHIVIGYFNLNSVMLTENKVRLTHYGFHYISGGGEDLEYCNHTSWHLPPERFTQTKVGRDHFQRAGDIWSWGIAMLELSIGRLFSEIWPMKQFYSILNVLIKKNPAGSIFCLLMDEIKQKDPNICMVSNDTIMTIIEKTLFVLPSQRPTAQQLLTVIIDDLRSSENGTFCHNEGISSDFEEHNDHIRELVDDKQIETVRNLPINEAFYLWKLCGSSIETILINHGTVKAKSPVFSLPIMTDGDCLMYGNTGMRIYGFTLDVFILPSNNLRDRLQSICRSKFLVSFELEERVQEKQDLSLIVKEKDIDYQARRMFILRRLLSSYPFKKSALFGECCHDVPPLYRADLWNALLNVHYDFESRFAAVDTLSPHPSDRQLLVDIPRCHQYDELMTSPTAQCKLKRLLKAWLLMHDNYVYWQGLDSLTAPFLILSFDRLATACSCLESFVELYLHNFFLKENSFVIQEYLAVFFHLLAFVDSSLYKHLFAMDFRPELFAIPWFLTCFAHILPFHKLFHIWDVLLLSDSSFPLFIGLAIMEQLRSRLITAHFNDAILLFSDLPDLNMERLIQDSLKYYNTVPPSCTFRQYASKNVREQYDMMHYSVSELNDFCCPRISAVDVSRLIKCSSLLVIDVRPQYEYSLGAIVNSVNLPPYAEEDTLDSISSIKIALLNAQLAGHIIVIADNGDLQRAKKISKLCVMEGYNRVCLLDGGVQKVRSMHSMF